MAESEKPSKVPKGVEKLASFPKTDSAMLQKAKLPERSFEAIRIYTFLSLLFIVLVAVMFYYYLSSYVAPTGTVLVPTLSAEELRLLLQELNISLSNSQARGLSDSLSSALESRAREQVSAAAGTPERGIETTTTGDGGVITVSSGGDGRTINIYVSTCCGNATTPTCSDIPGDEPTCQAYSETCGSDSDCCDPYSCVDGQCGFPTPECQEQGEYCASSTECCDNLQCGNDQTCQPPLPTCEVQGGTCLEDSDCCLGYSCQNGICEIPQPTCEGEGSYCASDTECCTGLECSPNQVCVPESTCYEENVACDSNSDCCEGLVCTQGACQPPPPSCEVAGGTCGTDADCCQGYTCQQGICEIPQPACGDSGDYCASSTECCSGYVCSSNQACIPEPTQLCSETDSGPDYYNAGSTTGYFNGLWGSYSDYCSGSTVYEYYCETEYGYDAQGYPTQTNTQNVRQTPLACANGCSAGACQ